MPSVGLIPFLPPTIKEELSCSRNVSMPSVGLIPFLQHLHTIHMLIPVCFNALSRAHSISTASETIKQGDTVHVSMPSVGLIPFLRYPLQTPDKIGNSRLNFRGYFTEYSENYGFSIKKWHVYNLFIIYLLLYYHKTCF